MGYQSLYANTTGTQNTAVGAAALDANTTASYNTALGYAALGANTGASNVAVGRYAMLTNTAGQENTAVGRDALRLNTTGSENTAVGFSALYAHTTGHYNSALGKNALGSSTTASYNTAIGNNAGSAVTTGASNVCIGYDAGNAITTGDNNVIIGYGSDVSAVDGDGANVLGRNVSGAAGYTTLGSGSDDIRAAHGNVTWATVSDERVKKDIEDSTAGLSFINDLRPRTFNYRNKGDIPEEFKGYEKDSTEPYKYATTNHGFIAQEVKEVIDNHTDIADGFKLWDVRESGQQEIAETALVPMLVKAIQELSAKVIELESKIEE